MKKYDHEILQIREEKFEEENSLVDEIYQSELEDFLQYISITALEVIKIVKSQHDEPEEKYSEAYQKCYLCLGMSRVFKINKLTRILEILEFVIDYGRLNLDFSKYSMIYLIELILDASNTILNEFIENGTSKFKLDDIISECETYLQTPLNQHNLEIASYYEKNEDEVLDSTLKEGSSSTKPSNFTNETYDLQEEILPPKQFEEAIELLEFSPEKAALVNEFCAEASDNLDQVELALIELEGSESPTTIVNQIFRSVHTVKGGARLLEVRKIEALAHQMESLLDDIRSNKMSVSENLIDILMEGNSTLLEMIKKVSRFDGIDTNVNDLMHQIYLARKGEKERPDISGIQEQVSDVSQVKNLEEKITEAKQTSEKFSSVSTEENIRVPAGKLEEVLNTASQVFITRIRLQNDTQLLETAISKMERLTRSAKLDKVADSLIGLNEKCAELRLQLISLSSLKSHASEKSLGIVNEISDILTSKNFKNLSDLPEEARLTLLRVEDIRKQLQKNVDELEGLSGRLQTGAMGFRMVPVGQLLNRFPAQVRELSRKIGKKTKLSIFGADTELDKILINQLADPLVHILRNSIDHGLEEADIRKKLGKNEIGELKIRAFYQGSNAIIEISDDGAGININKVLAAAIKQNLITEEEANGLNERDAIEFVFAPGLSTAKTVTELSGRGVGMDVVKTAVSAVQGSVRIESQKGVGTTVSIKLPLTLAIVGILLVAENGHQFAFPVLNVIEVLSIKTNDLKKVGDSLVLNYRGSTLNINSLSKFLGFTPSSFDESEYSVVVITDGERKLGIIVNKIMGRQDVLTKQFGSLLDRIEYMMGCTILSDGSLILILNVWELLSTKQAKQLQIQDPTKQSDVVTQRSAHKILVVDDSPMQRNRIGAILDQAGYLFETATDGHDALEKTRLTKFSAFCVDIIMPLMDGYEFIERLRDEEGYTDATVFMITGKNIEEGAEKRRLFALQVDKVFEKPVPAKEFIVELDKKLLVTDACKGAQ